MNIMNEVAVLYEGQFLFVFIEDKFTLFVEACDDILCVAFVYYLLCCSVGRIETLVLS